MNAFIVGTSVLVVLPFYLSVMNIEDKTYSYETYSIVAPLYFGVMNVLAQFLARLYGSFRGYVATTILSVAFVFGLNMSLGTYPFKNTKERLQYLLRLLLGHAFAFLIVLRTISRMR